MRFRPRIRPDRAVSLQSRLAGLKVPTCKGRGKKVYFSANGIERKGEWKGNDFIRCPSSVNPLKFALRGTVVLVGVSQ